MCGGEEVELSGAGNEFGSGGPVIPGAAFEETSVALLKTPPHCWK